MNSVKLENTIHKTLQAVIHPVSYLSITMEDIDDADERPRLLHRYAVGALRTEVLPAYGVKPDADLVTRMLDRLRTDTVASTWHGEPTLLHLFADHVVPTLTAFHHLRSRLPKKLVFSFASLLWMYKAHVTSRPTERSWDGMIKLMERVWETTSPKHQGLAVSILLSYEHLWRQDLNKVAELAPVLSDTLVNFRKVGFTNRFKKMAKYV